MMSHGLHHLATVTVALLVISQTCSTLTRVEARPNKNSPIQLNEQTWTRLLQGEWMFDLYAPWCPACKNLEPEWRKFAEWSDDLNINVASADVTTSPALSGRFMVGSLPTIYHVKDGVFRIYNGPREVTALINFIEEQGWKSVEPVSRWLAPDTLQMSLLAYSFGFGMTLHEIHHHLVEKVGIPYYVCYLIYVLCTGIIGTILGLIIVFVIDLFCPACQQGSQEQQGRKQRGASKKKDSPISDSDLDDRETNESAKPSSGAASERVRRRQKS